MIDSIKCFFPIDKYSRTKFIIINGLAYRFGDRNKGMGGQTFFLRSQSEMEREFLFLLNSYIRDDTFIVFSNNLLKLERTEIGL